MQYEDLKQRDTIMVFFKCLSSQDAQNNNNNDGSSSKSIESKMGALRLDPPSK